MRGGWVCRSEGKGEVHPVTCLEGTRGGGSRGVECIEVCRSSLQKVFDQV